MRAALALLALAALGAAPASAQTGAKALFYAPSGATLQSNAPAPSRARPVAPPSSTLGRGYPTSPPAPGAPVPPSAPAMVAPPDALPAGSPPAGTKDMVAVPAPAGVKYWVELLDPQGALRQVTADHVFRAGDRIKLRVVSNRDGYLTLVNLGTTGRTTVLFPSAAGASNAVRAGVTYDIPPGGYLRFDANPGQETLILSFSTTGPEPPPASAALAAHGAKDLVVEVDRASPQPATYAVAPGGPGGEGQTIAIPITLDHR